MSPGKIVRKRRSVVVEEKRVVGERTHGNANLTSKCDANREGNRIGPDLTYLSLFFVFLVLLPLCFRFIVLDDVVFVEIH